MAIYSYRIALIRLILVLPLLNSAHAADALSSATAGTDKDAGGELEEITVTATRAAESIDKIPISVTALTSEALESRGIRDIDDVTRMVPGVSFDHGLGSTATISIRGISSSSGAATTGVYINDTPIQSRDIGQGGTNTNAYPTIFDLDRVEVLRGPQGTLFGAGSQGGTIRFITPQPDLVKSSAFIRTELASVTGGEPTYDTGIAVGTPLVQDKLAIRLSGDFRHEGGYIDRVNPLNGDMLDRNSDWTNNSSLRLALTYAPTDSVKITPSILYQRTFINNKSAIWNYLSDRGADEFRTGAQVEEPTADKMVLSALDVSIDLGGMTLYSNTGYFSRNYKVTQNFSNFIPGVVGFQVLPGAFIPNLPGWTSQGTDFNTQGNFSQELRLQSTDPNRSLKWVTGLFFQRAVQNTAEYVPETTADYNAFSNAIFGADGIDVFGLPLGSPSTPRFPSGTEFSFVNETQGVDKQIAAFADVTYKITDRLSVNGGIRAARTEFDFAAFGDGPYAGGPSFQTGQQKEHPITPKVNISFQADSDNLFYASAAKGFRGGGVNSPVSGLCSAQLAALGYSTVPRSYNSDSVWSYEIGSKNAFADRRIRVETSVYWINWSAIQQSIYLSDCGNNFTANIGKATSKGADISLEARPFDALTLYASAGYTKAEYAKTVSAPGTVIVNKGDALGATPLIVAAGMQYAFDAFDHHSYARLDYSYKSANPDNTPQFDRTTVSFDPRAWAAPSSQIVNTRLGTHFGATDVSLFIDNLLNSHTSIARVNLAPSNNEIDEFAILRPRTIGITASYRY